jgi:hypothetical protein
MVWTIVEEKTRDTIKKCIEICGFLILLLSFGISMMTFFFMLVLGIICTNFVPMQFGKLVVFYNDLERFKCMNHD